MRSSIPFRAGSAFVLSYVGLILFGMLLLCVTGLPVGKALFTSISAITLTGMNIAHLHSIHEMVVLMLVELGAINIISFALYFYKLLGQSAIFEDASIKNEHSFRSFFPILKKACLFLFSMELLSCVAVWFFQTSPHEDGLRRRIFHAVFTGVTAFCHAGFAGTPHSMGFQGVFTYISMLVMAGIIIAGSMGYPVIMDLISIKRLRSRMLNPDRNWTFHTRLIIYASALILVIGSALYYYVEGSAEDSPKLVEDAINAIFKTADIRTAGIFHPGICTHFTFTVVCWEIMMFIGGGAASTTGGLKISLVYSLFRPKSLQFKAAIKIFAFAAIIVGIAFIILILNNESPYAPGYGRYHNFDILFNEISAFTSTGITQRNPSSMPALYQAVFAISMLAGRIGIPLSGFMLLYRRRQELSPDTLLL
jgi:Trk-type K+ transport system membrane component